MFLLSHELITTAVVLVMQIMDSTTLGRLSHQPGQEWHTLEMCSEQYFQSYVVALSTTRGMCVHVHTHTHRYVKTFTYTCKVF